LIFYSESNKINHRIKICIKNWQGYLILSKGLKKAYAIDDLEDLFNTIIKSSLPISFF